MQVHLTFSPPLSRDFGLVLGFEDSDLGLRLESRGLCHGLLACWPR